MLKFVRLPEVLKAVALSERTLYLYMAQGKFPKPVKVGAMSMWVESEIRAWQDAQLAARNQEMPV